MKKAFSIASLASTLLLVASSAFAQIPPPPGAAPGVGESPATGQTDPAPLPAPIGRNSSVKHPDWRVGNTLTDDWFEAMHSDLYYFQQHIQTYMNWSKGYYEPVYRHASWINYLLEKYYFSCYDSNGKARWYSYGKCTRGDFNYYYYYWIRAEYYNLVRHSDEYYREYKHKSSHSNKVRDYKSYMKNVYNYYHRFTKCNYGFNGDDTKAADDTEAASLEADLGIF